MTDNDKSQDSSDPAVDPDTDEDKKLSVTLGQWLTADLTVKKTVTKKGKAFLRPQLESVCVVSVDYNDNEISDHCKELYMFLTQHARNRLELKLGSADGTYMLGLEKLLMTMTESEECLFIISSCHGSEEGDIILKVTLHSFTVEKPIWQMSSKEKYSLAFSHKERGTELFKEGNIEGAFVQYGVAIKYALCMCESSVCKKLEKTMIQEHATLMSICYLNLAACHSKMANYENVISSCTKALAVDADNVKGLYRRAQAYKAIGQIDKARLDLKQALKIEPQNKAVITLLHNCET
ncbi:peptidyl-prolyl cis-trans isomerase FKBP5 [Biomphalaria pfeifferi]|uniref:Peptidyl-prolyl cis-trans isomerase FKBP5 n=1 Tax=Biomphalaria pfeifferi TaxID=112525 RepID=A0AAD8F6S5_BIOPF|nr:peptidyl-prolyl cis-trans isomerase FKBP5 [Biomphalaria pfeifferi]